MKLSRNCCLVLRKCTILLKIFHYIFHHHPYNSACPLHIIVFFLAVGFHIGDLSHCASPAENLCGKHTEIASNCQQTHRECLRRGLGFVIKAWEENNCVRMCEIQQQFYPQILIKIPWNSLFIFSSYVLFTTKKMFHTNVL